VARPDGSLSSGGEHLFYEALTAARWQTNSGWVVPAAQWPGWIEGTLPRLGLNAQEVGDFYRDWAANLPPAPYYLVAPQPESVPQAAAPLQITPPPTTLYRLWLYVAPEVAPVPVQAPSPPILTARRGFTVVEWGVYLGGDAVPLHGVS